MKLWSSHFYIAVRGLDTESITFQRTRKKTKSQSLCERTVIKFQY